MNYHDTNADRDLLLTFFLTFSRFEYALKTGGFFKKPNETRYDARTPPPAEPDWDSFAGTLRTIFSAQKSQDLAHACDYLLSSPPNKQVVIRDASGFTIGWETPVRSNHETDIEFMLRMVRSIRNNLFHGGKYSIEVHEDTARTEHLLNSSLVVLEQCLVLSPDVKRYFDEAII
jgi:hypothetical protein